MPQRSVLTATAPAVEFSNGTVLRSPGLRGSVTQWTDLPGDVRSRRLPAEEDVAPRFRRALEEVGIREIETVHFEVMHAPVGGGTRSAAQNDLLEMELPSPPTPGVQVILYQDESGGLSWHYPDGHSVTDGHPDTAMQRGGKIKFTIPGRTRAAQLCHAADRPPTHLRGPITKVGRKILKVLFVPLLANVVKTPLQKLAAWAEERYLQHGIRLITADNYRERVDAPFNDWQSLVGKRSLLVVHGIFSTIEGMLGGAPRQEVEALCARYEGRVIGLNQHTVTWSPEDNAQYFLREAVRNLGGGGADFDILCHSRGGIVSRVLVERGQLLLPGHPCRFRKVYFAGTPNAGSALGDPRHMVEMIDTFTNLATSIPDGPVAYTIEVILALIKIGAYSGLSHLPGIATMDPSGYIKKVLNADRTPSDAVYGAATAHFQPSPKRDNGWMLQCGNVLADRIFNDEGEPYDNDLVVPSHGVWGANGHPEFPIRDHLIYDREQGVHHVSLFHQERTWEHIQRFLSGPDKAAPTRDGTPQSAYRNVEYKHAVSPAAPLFPATPPDHRNPVSREPRADFPASIEPGFRHALTVSLWPSTGHGPGTLVFGRRHPGEPVFVDAHLYAPGFEIEGDAVQRITLQESPNSELERVVFPLIARQGWRGRRTLRVEFWHEGAVVGTLSRDTEVRDETSSRTTPAAPGASGSVTQKDSFEIPPVRRETCDLIVFVQGDDQAGKPPFRLSMQCNIVGHEFSARYLGKLSGTESGQPIADYVRTTFADAMGKMPQRGYFEPEDYRRALGEWNADLSRIWRKLGERVWHWLPEKFRAAYWEIRDNEIPVRSIQIHSDEWGIPWELIIPNRTIAGRVEREPPLGQAYVMGRWRPGIATRPQPQRAVAQGMRVIAPNYVGGDALRSAQDEADEILKRFNKAQRVEPARASEVQRLLEGNAAVSWLHICCHGDFEAGNADISALHLEESTRLRALDLQGAAMLAASNPFVVLNACHVGKSGVVGGQLGGFNAILLENGCSGVLAPLWEVDDKKAKEFAMLLYDKLTAGLSIGEALQEIRTLEPDDPTFAAFVYCGDPWARINLRSLQGA